MSDTDHAHEAVERLDYDDQKADRPGFDRRSFLRRTALTGAAAGSVSSPAERLRLQRLEQRARARIFGTSESYKFTFVNHVTTNPFFVPTQYGIQDACKLLGCTYAWTGSETSNVSQMVNAVNSAVSAGSRRHRRLADRPDGVQRARQERAEREYPGRRLQRRREPPANDVWPTSARTCSSRANRWANTSRSSCPRATSRCSSRRRAQPTSSRGSKAR